MSEPGDPTDIGAIGAPRHDQIGPTTRMECKICWHVYDPALGDEVWQIPPGTPFTALPPHWSCPNCSALQHQFLLVDE